MKKRIAVFAAIVVGSILFNSDELMAAASLTTLHVFNGTDGNDPVAPLVLGTNGNFYSITSYGGADTNDCIDGCGTIFEISPDGAFTLLHSFTNYDGSAPRAGLLQASDGDLYGTTSGGGFFGPGGLGTVYRMTPGGIVTMIHSFDIGGGGISPEGELMQDSDGYIYGTTASGSPPNGGVGSVFRITTNGTFTAWGIVDQPTAGVVQHTNGMLYGTTEFGGSSTNCIGGCGTVFVSTPGGVATTLYSFNRSDGSAPVTELTVGADGNLYGTTSGGHTGLAACSNGCGTVFMITTNGALTTLHTFSGSDGREPQGRLVQGTDGMLYGTTAAGGGSSFGSVFQISTNGDFTKLLAFNGANGGNPRAGLVQGTDGTFYGTTSVGGGASGLGTVFKLTLNTNAGSLTCVLSPSLATNTIGTTHTVVATVSSNGVPRIGAVVAFSVIAGPNQGQGRSAITLAGGQASFSYTGSLTPGVDTIRAASLGAIGLATNLWVAPDSVGDGIPDWWRAQYFGGNGTTTNSQSCAMCDADGTGQNNRFKYVAGLNPTNAASVFALSARSVSGQATQRDIIYGPIASGRTYNLHFATDLSGGWAVLTGTGSPTTNQNQVTVTDLGATQPMKFYRISISYP